MRDGEITYRAEGQSRPQAKPNRPHWTHGVGAAMQSILARLGSDKLRQWLPLATLVILVAIVGVMQPVFLEPSTLLQLASDTAVLFILATGVTFVIMLGGIDLSIQSMASLASVIVALTVARLGHGHSSLRLQSAPAGLLFRAGACAAEGSSFIATLAMGGVLFSTALVTSKERSSPLAMLTAVIRPGLPERFLASPM